MHCCDKPRSLSSRVAARCALNSGRGCVLLCVQCMPQNPQTQSNRTTRRANNRRTRHQRRTCNKLPQNKYGGVIPAAPHSTSHNSLKKGGGGAIDLPALNRRSSSQSRNKGPKRGACDRDSYQRCVSSHVRETDVGTYTKQISMHVRETNVGTYTKQISMYAQGLIIYLTQEILENRLGDFDCFG